MTKEQKEPDYIIKHYVMHDDTGRGSEKMEKLLLAKAGTMPKEIVNYEIFHNDMGTYPVYTLKVLYKA